MTATLSPSILAAGSPFSVPWSSPFAYAVLLALGLAVWLLWNRSIRRQVRLRTHALATVRQLPGRGGDGPRAIVNPPTPAESSPTSRPAEPSWLCREDWPASRPLIRYGHLPTCPSGTWPAAEGVMPGAGTSALGVDVVAVTAAGAARVSLARWEGMASSSIRHRPDITERKSATTAAPEPGRLAERKRDPVGAGWGLLMTARGVRGYARLRQRPAAVS